MNHEQYRRQLATRILLELIEWRLNENPPTVKDAHPPSTTAVPNASDEPEPAPKPDESETPDIDG